RAVGSEEPDDLALGDVEVDPVDRADLLRRTPVPRRESLHQSACPDHRSHAGKPPPGAGGRQVNFAPRRSAAAVLCTRSVTTRRRERVRRAGFATYVAKLAQCSAPPTSGAGEGASRVRTTRSSARAWSGTATTVAAGTWTNVAGTWARPVAARWCRAA